MKRGTIALILIITATAAICQDAPGNFPGVEPEYNFLEWVKANLDIVVGVLIALFEFIVRITPTDRDNTIFGTIKRWLDVIIPNRATTDADDIEINPKGLRVHR